MTEVVQIAVHCFLKVAVGKSVGKSALKTESCEMPKHPTVQQILWVFFKQNEKLFAADAFLLCLVLHSPWSSAESVRLKASANT